MSVTISMYGGLFRGRLFVSLLAATQRASLLVCTRSCSLFKPCAQQTDYCCMGVMDTLQVVCGVDGAVAPCRMPQGEYQRDVSGALSIYVQRRPFRSFAWLLILSPLRKGRLHHCSNQLLLLPWYSSTKPVGWLRSLYLDGPGWASRA